MSSPLISFSVDRSKVSGCCGLICSTVGVLALLGGVHLAESLGSSLGLDGPFLVPVLRLWSVSDQTVGACPLGCVIPVRRRFMSAERLGAATLRTGIGWVTASAAFPDSSIDGVAVPRRLKTA